MATPFAVGSPVSIHLSTAAPWAGHPWAGRTISGTMRKINSDETGGDVLCIDPDPSHNTAAGGEPITLSDVLHIGPAAAMAAAAALAANPSIAPDDLAAAVIDVLENGQFIIPYEVHAQGQF